MSLNDIVLKKLTVGSFIFETLSSVRNVHDGSIQTVQYRRLASKTVLDGLVRNGDETVTETFQK